jgi:hypothetical protein
VSPTAPSPPRGPRRAAAKAGFVLSAFAVFACGWLATRSSDWKTAVLYSALAIGAAALASAFSRAPR